MNIKRLASLSKEIRRQTITMVYKSKSGHLGCSLGIVDILTTLYFSILKVDPKKPNLDHRDRFILSKGHACTALYAVLSKKGFFSPKLLDTYFSDGSVLAGHITYGALAGVEATAGSLGHGLSIGIGMATALKSQKSKARVFVLVGDGEANEGSVWEGIEFAGQHNLNNIVLVIDYNNLQILGKSADILNRFPFKDKIKGFGWDVKEVDGHNYYNLQKVLRARFKKPLAIVAKTVKGKGVSYMENKVEWHGKCPTPEEYEVAMKELS